MNSMNNWNTKQLLADLIGHTAKVKPKERAEIWASDLGKPFIDRFLAMKGTPYTNPAQGEQLVSFFLGKALEEGLTKMLTACGLAYESQEKLTIELPKCLPLVGKPDLVLEVKSWDKVIKKAEEAAALLTDEEEEEKKKELVRRMRLWQDRYPDGLPKTVVEIKSVNSWAFSYHQKSGGLGNAYPHHHLQLYTYLYGLNLEEGHLLYVARDTGFMEEVVILRNKRLEKQWREDILKISHYFKENIRPPREALYDEKGKINWRAKFSPYRDLVYPELLTKGSKEK